MAPTEPPVIAPPPERIAHYEVARRLARGGTSDVLLARAQGFGGEGRHVVLKLLLPQHAGDPSYERMFQTEAAAYARLGHPAVVRLLDFFSHEGQPVMVLEYVDGMSLGEVRQQLRTTAEDLDDRAALFVGSRVLAALAAAHGARDPKVGGASPVIHRDVNPSNILIPWDGHAKLADFGIAKVAGMPSDTMVGSIKGTYGYMAPEQVRGETVTPFTDVYAASLVLWELLARRRAIQHRALPDAEVMRAMADPHLPSLDVLRPALPPGLRDALRRGLEPSPALRRITAAELLEVVKASTNLDEGRVALATVMARLRPAEPSPSPPRVTPPPAPEVPVAATIAAPPPAADTSPDALPSPPSGHTITAVTAHASVPEFRRPNLTLTPSNVSYFSLAAPVPFVPSPSRLAEEERLAGSRGDVSPPPPAALTATQAASTAVGAAAMAAPAPGAPGAQRPSPPPAATFASPPPAAPPATPVPPPVPAPLGSAPRPLRSPPPPAPPKASAVQTFGRPGSGRPGASSSAPPPPNLGDRISGAPTSGSPSSFPPGLEGRPSRVGTLAGVPPPAFAGGAPQMVASAAQGAGMAGSSSRPPPAPTHEPSVVVTDHAGGATVTPRGAAPLDGQAVFAETLAGGPMPAPRPGMPPGPPPARPPPPSRPGAPPSAGRPPAPRSSGMGIASGPGPAFGNGAEITASLSAFQGPSRGPWLVAGGLGALAVLGLVVFLVLRGPSGTAVGPDQGAPRPTVAAAAQPVPTPAPSSAPPPSPAISATATKAPTVASAPPAVPAPSAAPAPAAPATVAAVRPPPSADDEAEPPPEKRPPRGGAKATTGVLRPPASAKGHRVFVDGRVMGEGTAPITLPCGKHTVKVGSSGHAHPVDVPCGGEVKLTK